jgi:hypothetical protein
VSPCCCDDVIDGYRDKGTPEVGGPKFRRLNCNTRRQLDRDPFDLGGFIAEIESLMPQLSEGHIVYRCDKHVNFCFLLLSVC